MKRIYLPIDGSECSNRAIEYCAKLAPKLKSEIIMIYVIEAKKINYPEFFSGSMGGELVEKLQETAKNLASEILNTGKKRILSIDNTLEPKISLKILSGDPAELITSTAKEDDADLIVMGSSGMGSGIKNMLLGSVTNKVIHNTDIPVLVIK